METEGWVRQLTMDIQGQKLSIPIYLLPVSRAYLILGSPWLATLGPHIVDYVALTLKFFHHRKFLTLQGEGSSTPTQARLHRLQRLHATSAIFSNFVFHLMQHDGPDDNLIEFPVDIAPEIATLLHTYSVVFQSPTSLPLLGIKTMSFPSTPMQSLLKSSHIDTHIVKMSTLKKWYMRCYTKASFSLVLALFHHLLS